MNEKTIMSVDGPRPLEQQIASILNCYSAENESDTPDFILAAYLLACLSAFNAATRRRETWYGRDKHPLPESTDA